MSTTTTKRNRSAIEPAFALVEGEDYEELLTCCICTELVFKRIFLQCGHSFCKKCLDQSKTCPKCRGSKEHAREILSELEKVVYEKILVECNQCEKQMNCHLAEKHKEGCWRYPCKNKGCTDWTRDQTLHNSFCVYRQRKCDYIRKCKWKGLAKDYEAHRNRHREFEEKQKKLQAQFSLLKQEYAITVIHGHPKQQFIPLEESYDYDWIENLKHQPGNRVSFILYDADTEQDVEFNIAASDPRLLYRVANDDELEAEKMEVIPCWDPTREEAEDESQFV